jgi:hydroxyacylglutathione hydrolase
VKQLAEGVWQLKQRLPIPNAINTYLLGDVLVDAGARADGKVILKELEGRPVSAHALTHAHPDHQGASKLVCERLGVPFWVSEGDAAKAEDPQEIRREQPERLINKVFFKVMAGPGHPVDRRLKEGDEVAGFTVLETPGHSKGHVSFWRESDRVLVLGDVLNNMDVITTIPGLREPKTYFTPDPAQNRKSIKRLGELEPSLVLFGHGAPLRDTRKFVDFCASVPG